MVNWSATDFSKQLQKTNQSWWCRPWQQPSSMMNGRGVFGSVYTPPHFSHHNSHLSNIYFFFCKLESDHPESNYSSGIKGDTKIRSNPRIFFFISLISLSSYPPLSCLMTWKSISVQYLKWFPKMDRREVWGGSLEDRKHTAVLFLYLLVVLVIYCKTNCIIRHFIQCKCEYIVTNTVMVTSYLGS